MEASRTSCPRISVWEDALLDGLIAAVQGPSGTQGGIGVVLTPAGRAHLARVDRAGPAA